MSEERVIKMIKSCIVSRKGGVPIDEIENDYKELVGENIPYYSLGYRDLEDFLNHIEHIQIHRNYLGDLILSVADPKIAHIDSLVNKQKAPTNRYKNSKRRREGERRGEERFKKNKQMAYTQSKWYSDRPKDSWTKNKNESRKNKRYNNFNAGRSLAKNNCNNNSTMRNDNSWSPKSVSPVSSKEDNLYNFQSEDERRYAQQSRSWKFQVQVADDGTSNPTVRNSRIESPRPHYPQPWNAFDRPSMWGPGNNNLDYWWRNSNWYPNSNFNPNYYGYHTSQMQSHFSWDSNGWSGPPESAVKPSTPWMQGSPYPAPEVSLEPLINGHQLIGDDFFLQLAIKNLKATATKPRVNAAIECGLCISGQTIDEARQRIEKMHYLSSHVAILLGAVDIFRGHSLERMVNDMKKLLDVCRNRFNITNITLCTIPPLANYSVRFNLPKLSVLYSFNNWIKLHSNFNPDDSYIHHYNVIDLFAKLTDANHRTLYSYFQIDARMVSGCQYPHILWNGVGRRKVISMLES